MTTPTTGGSKIAKYLKELISIPSENPPGRTIEVIEWLTNKFNALGFSTKIVEPRLGKANMVAWKEGLSPGMMLLFNGHVDTVTVNEKLNWSFDPFEGRMSDGWVYGRGAADEKGSFAALLAALDSLNDMRLRKGVMVQAVCDEETMGSCGTAYLIKEDYCKADSGVVTESSVRDGRSFLRIAMRGIMRLQLETFGKSAHASRPHAGVNANLKMAKLLLNLEKMKLAHQGHRLYGSPTMSTGTFLKGGRNFNVLPDHCIALSDIRTVPGMTTQGVLKDISEVIRKLSKHDNEMKAVAKVFELFKPASISRQEPIVSLVRDVAKEILGYTPLVEKNGGATDAGLLINEAKIPTIVGLGPGDVSLGNIHGSDERVSIEALLEYSKLYSKIVKQMNQTIGFKRSKDLNF
jgi:succinyl-diaminopimelate desuccinylase